MILRQIYLYLGDEPDLPVPYTYAFLLRSRSVCNYLEREVLARLRYRTERFNRIVLSARSAPRKGVFVNTEGAATVDIPFDRAAYERRSGEGLETLGTYYVERLREGVAKCARSVSVPEHEIVEGLDAFVAGGMKNEWVHKKRTFRALGLRAELDCRMTQEVFTLRLIVSDAGGPVLDRQILKAEPNEIVFGYRFKDIVLDRGHLAVTSKHGEPLWRERVSALTRRR